MKPRRAEFTGWASLSISIIEHSAERREETDSRIRAERGAVQSGDRLEDQQKQGGCAGRRAPLFLFLDVLASPHLSHRLVFSSLDRPERPEEGTESIITRHNDC